LSKLSRKKRDNGKLATAGQSPGGNSETGRDPHIDVAVALPVYRSYTYHVPEDLRSAAAIGKRILVPFGHRRVTGYILGFIPPDERIPAKDVLEVLDSEPVFQQNMIPFFKWIAAYYLYPLGQVIAHTLPGGLNLREQRVLSITDTGRQVLADGSANDREQKILALLERASCRPAELCRDLGASPPDALLLSMQQREWIESATFLSGGRTRPKTERYIAAGDQQQTSDGLSAARRRVLIALSDGNEMPLSELRRRVPRASNVLGALQKAGLVRVFDKQVYRDPFGEPISSDIPPTLTAEQRQAVDRLSGTLGRGYTAFLLTGVTGSGKTEVYMRAAEAVIARGASVIVLVPEIALISQMERRFRARFGECVALLHSGLSDGERYDQWRRIIKGSASIAIGARSAIFAPFANIGLIIVDEEHDASYKQESHLRYNARDLAVIRARQQGGIALMGSATPSLQSYYNTTIGKFTELRLTSRIQNRPLPQIDIVDLRRHRDQRGVHRFISPKLHQEMQHALSRGEQTLLFLNRRGFASLPLCAGCGQPFRCRNCDISLTHHRQARAFRCHHCGYSRPEESACPLCGSTKVKLLGMGTEKIEAAAQKLFPEARIARLDRDTTVRKGSVVKILKGLKNRSIDILVGTQMVAKGHDFPHITLVGIICADLTLSFPDFRSGERTFQLLAQVAGRAGRGDAPGRVVLQTYSPEHFTIRAARDQDFRAFFDSEIPFRKALGYPPFARLAQLRISGRDQRKTAETAGRLGDRGRGLLQEDGGFAKSIELLGPIEAPLAKIASRHRWQILLKGRDSATLHRFVSRLAVDEHGRIVAAGVRVVVDIDPFFML